MEIDSKDASIWDNLGIAYEYLKDLENARDAYKLIKDKFQGLIVKFIRYVAPGKIVKNEEKKVKKVKKNNG